MGNKLAVTEGGVHKVGKKAFLTVNGVHRKAKKAWRTTNGVHRLCYKAAPNSTSLAHKGTVSSLSNAVWRLSGGEIKGKYALFCGGWLSSGYAQVVDSYDESLSKKTVSLPIDKANGACASTGTKCIFAGGSGSAGLASQSPVIGEDLTVSTISHPEATHLLTGTFPGGTTLNGKAFFAGGQANEAKKATAGVIDDDLTVTLFDNLSAARYEGGCANINQKFALYGGGYTDTPSSNVDCYDKDGTHSVLTSLSVARNRLVAANQTDRAMFAGGYGTAFVSAVEIYDENLTLKTIASLSQARYQLPSGSFEYGCVFAGGFYATATGGTSTACDFFDADCTRSTVSGLTAVHGAGAGATVNNYFIIAGGADRYSQGTRQNVARAFTYTEVN